MRQNVVPQLPDARDRFSDATDPPGPVQGGLLLCDLQMPGTSWFLSRPDIRARVRFGSSAPVVVDGPDNRDQVTVSVPVASLEVGQELAIEALDRDLFNRDDFLDRGEVAYAGRFPLFLTGAGRKLRATCRLMDSETVAGWVESALASASQPLASFEKAAARPIRWARQDLGYPWHEHVAAEDAIDGVAALQGWGDAPRALAARLEAAREARNARAAEAVRSMGASAHAPDAVLGLDADSVGPFTLHCGAAARAVLAGTAAAGDAPRCVLDVGYSGDSPITLGAGIGWRLDAVFARGTTEPLYHVADKPGHVYFVVGGVPHAAGRSPLRDVALIRAVDGERVELVRAPERK